MALRWIVRSLFALGGLVALVALLALVYAVWVWSATRGGVARVDGTETGLPVRAPVTIARDGRGVPHIRAGSVHDLFVAEGYAMASDRLFQMDLTRRFVDGRLAEVLGPPVVAVDRRMRRFGIRELAARVYASSNAEQREVLGAFADGVNAAAQRQPTPPEYKAFFFSFEPWRPEDALAVGFATVLDLDDKPDDVVIRDLVHTELGQAGVDALYPLTDPRYDVPTNGRPPGPIANLPNLPGVRPDVAVLRQAQHDTDLVILSLSKGGNQERPPTGSNAWAVGAERTTVGRAMLANDPHLDIGIPGIWYLVEASAPGLHVGGAALAGTPGVTLGHNEHLAWGVTAGETAAMHVVRERTRGSDELFEHGRWVHARHRTETIGVRFGRTVEADLLESDRGVVMFRNERSGVAYLMDWRLRRNPVSPLAPFFDLLRARNAADGIAAMRELPEPALNVVFADDAGRVAYHFAGGVPLEPSWGRWTPDGDAPAPAYLTYASAPHVDPSRSALVVTANNRADGDGSPRLAPFWPPPYRAYEIRRALAAAAGARGRLSPEAIAAGQRDATSPAENEFAGLVRAALQHKHYRGDPSTLPLVTALSAFDGAMSSESRGASVVVALRRDMLAALAKEHLPEWLAPSYPATSPGFEVVLRALRERPHGWVPHDDYDQFAVDSLQRVAKQFGGTVPAFGTYAAQPLAHPLARFGLGAWNGPTMPGRGGSFAPAVQWNGHAQSFRAVWIAGDWDRGTIDVDAGESGEPASPHYADQTAGWVSFARTPLPFSDAAVRAATRSTLTLTR